jgi:hypothetical protein
MKKYLSTTEKIAKDMCDILIKNKDIQKIIFKDTQTTITFAEFVAYIGGVEEFICLDIPKKFKSDLAYTLLLYYTMSKDEQKALIESMDETIEYDWFKLGKEEKKLAPYIIKKFPLNKAPYVYLLSNRKKDIRQALKYYEDESNIPKSYLGNASKAIFRLPISKVLESELLKSNNINLIVAIARTLIYYGYILLRGSHIRMLNILRAKNISALDLAKGEITYSKIFEWITIYVYGAYKDEENEFNNNVIEFFTPVFQKYRNEFNIKTLNENTETSIDISPRMVGYYKEFVKKEKKEVV